MEGEHYLKQELYKLVQNDISIFEFIQSGSLDGIWYWDLENPENEWMSPRFWEILGYNPEEMKHLSSEWQDIIFQDDLERAVENFNRHIEDPAYPYDQIVRYKHNNGSTVWVRCRGIAIRDNDGKPLRMLGAHNDITAIMQAEHELNEKREIEELNKKLYKRAHEDYLTGLLNRGAIEDRLHHLIEMAKRDKALLSIVMIDIDFFKRVNDTYGHIEGDNVLTKLAKLFIDTSRTSDVIGRYGGEEFIILMPHTNNEEAIVGAERVRINVQNQLKGRYENLTISAGVSTVKPTQEVDVKALAVNLFKECDEALYAAKKSGRNKVVHIDELHQFE